MLAPRIRVYLWEILTVVEYEFQHWNCCEKVYDDLQHYKWRISVLTVYMGHLVKMFLPNGSLRLIMTIKTLAKVAKLKSSLQGSSKSSDKVKRTIKNISVIVCAKCIKCTICKPENNFSNHTWQKCQLTISH